MWLSASSSHARHLLLASAGAAWHRQSQRGISVGFEQPGKPEEVLKHFDANSHAKPTNVEPGQVGIQMLYAPINPSDVNMIEGVYPVKRALPAICGNEGVGKVIALPSNGTTGLQIGDLVCPVSTDFGGTWRSHAVVSQDHVIKMPSSLKPDQAATLCVNPSTAFRMLHDFVALQDGDVVIQNGATSAVGLAVIDIAKAMKLKTVNVIRKKDDEAAQKQVVAKLVERGADLILFDKDLGNAETMAKMAKLSGRPKLGLNCVGGQATTDMIRLMGKGSVLVTYGGMSKKPVTISTGALIFDNITFKGYWMTEWVRTHTREEIQEMHNSLATLIQLGKLSQNVSYVPLSLPPSLVMKEYYNNPKRMMTKLVYDCQI